MGDAAKGRVDEEICRRDLPYRHGQTYSTSPNVARMNEAFPWSVSGPKP